MLEEGVGFAGELEKEAVAAEDFDADEGGKVEGMAGAVSSAKGAGEAGVGGDFFNRGSEEAGSRLRDSAIYLVAIWARRPRASDRLFATRSGSRRTRPGCA
jgi:hypothetical protein